MDHTRHFFAGGVTFAAFLDRYRDEDYFRLTKFDATELAERFPGTGTVPEHFGCLMTELARRENSSWWLEKTPKHTVYWEELRGSFPDAVYLVIRRNFRATLLSSLNLYGNPTRSRSLQIARKSFRYASDAAALDAFGAGLDPERMHTVRFEDLRRDPEGESREICRFLGIEERILESRFPRNTSYRDAEGVRFALTSAEWWMARLLARAVRALPCRLVIRIRKIWDRRRAVRFPKYPAVPDD